MHVLTYICTHIHLRVRFPQAIMTVASDMILGDAEVGLAAGAESMSQAPYVVRNTRFGTPLGVDPKMVDSLRECLTDQVRKEPSH